MISSAAQGKLLVQYLEPFLFNFFLISLVGGCVFGSSFRDLMLRSHQPFSPFDIPAFQKEYYISHDRRHPSLDKYSNSFAIANYPSPDTQPEERSSNGASLHLKSHSYTCRLFLWFLFAC
ncbi:hypothetical protein TWF173_011221 [Orbilia oligospora]|nr:hypothetical protein TWF173_011221 [Orbilia oligospora]